MTSKVAGLLLAALMVAGCRHAPPPPATGTSSFTVIEPPPAAPPASSTEAATREPTIRSQYNEARPIKPLVMPIYPPKALTAKTGWATVGVRVTVAATGRVTEIKPSVLAMSTPGRFADDFREAVETALRQWKFVPAEIQHLEPIPGLEIASNRITHTEKTEAEFDLSFTFTADGQVQGLPSGK